MRGPAQRVSISLPRKTSPVNVQRPLCNNCQCDEFLLSFRTTTATQVGETRVNSEGRATSKRRQNLTPTENLIGFRRRTAWLQR
jgi:hypothetical protein